MNFHDLQAQYDALKPQIDAGIAEVISSGAFILGKPVGELESRLAADTGRAHCVTCGNGTDALVLALRMWGVGPGDAVFVPDFTYFASAGCAASVGATAYPVDVREDTFNLCPDALERAVVRVEREGAHRPRVAIAVDLFGLPADYPRIEAVARAHGLRLLEDAAQGYGGAIGGKAACAFGDAAITSFFPAKPLGCYGDGGAVFTDDDGEDALLRSLRANGRSPADKYDNVRFGINSRLDTLQAAILLPKLAALRRCELAALDAAARRYDALLAGAVETPVVPEGYQSSWAQYTVKLKSRAQRDAAKAALAAAGVPAMVYYPRAIHRQGAFADRGFDDADFPATLSLCDRVLSLPMHPYLTDADAEAAARALCDFIRENP